MDHHRRLTAAEQAAERAGASHCKSPVLVLQGDLVDRGVWDIRLLMSVQGFIT